MSLRRVVMAGVASLGIVVAGGAAAFAVINATVSGTPVHQHEIVAASDIAITGPTVQTNQPVSIKQAKTRVSAITGGSVTSATTVERAGKDIFRIEVVRGGRAIVIAYVEPDNGNIVEWVVSESKPADSDDSSGEDHGDDSHEDDHDDEDDD